MFVAMSQRSRRFVGRLDRGQELFAALRTFCREHDVKSGEIRASGLLGSAELAPYDREARGYAAPRRLRAFFELIHLHGTVAVRDGEVTLSLHATLARDNQDRGGGIDILGGLLLAAEVLSCEFVLEAFDDVVLVREFDPTVGIYALARSEARSFVREEVSAPRPAPLPLGVVPVAERPRPQPAPVRPVPREPEVLRARPVKPAPKIPEGRPPPRPSASPEAVPQAEAAPSEPTWEDAVRRSVQLGESSDGVLSLGDIIEHPRFGRCEVERIDEGAERVAVRLSNGRTVELGLEVLRLEHLRKEGARQYFRAHPAKR
jgi:predicted DNA-binding protein with PD1-like motif